MSDLSLYQLSEEYKFLLEKLYDQETGELNQEVEAQINALQPSLQKKCISVANFIKKLESEKRELQLMKQEIHKREETYNKEISNMQEYLKENMEKNGITKISCPFFTLQIKKNPYSTEIYNENDIPPEFIKVKEIVKVESVPDKELIKKEVLETGKQVPGAIVKQKTKLIITVDNL